MKNSRRKFIVQSAKAVSGAYLGVVGFSAKSYANIIGANERVRVGVVGFSDRFRGAHLPSFMQHNKELNFDIVAVSDIWKVRREEGVAYLKQKMDHDIRGAVNNEALYDAKDIDAVFISTADFQHANHAAEFICAIRQSAVMTVMRLLVNSLPGACKCLIYKSGG